MGNVHEVSDSKYYINRQHRVEFYVQQFFFRNFVPISRAVL